VTVTQIPNDLVNAIAKSNCRRMKGLLIMPRKRAPIDHTEFGGGPGLIDPVLREDRLVSANDQLKEIYATNPNDPEADPATSDLYAVPRPAPVVWKDPSTAAGTT
jgi:hypothetical protein